MGTIKTGFLGEFNGKLGTAVGFNRKGIITMRARPKGRRSSFSLAQLEQQEKCALMINFLQPLSELSHHIIAAFYGEPDWITSGDPNTPARSLPKAVQRASRVASFSLSGSREQARIAFQ